MPALVILSTPPAPVQPAGEAVITGRVRNTGSVVDQFTFEVLGPAAEWAAVEPRELSLFPGADGELKIVLRPPLGAHVPAGPVAIGLMTRSAADGATSVEEATVSVLPAVVVGARLVPRRSKGASGAKHRVKLRNTGNVAATVELSASDPDETLVLRVSPTTMTLPPGGQAEARVRLRPTSRTWTGGAEPKDFTVSVVPQGAPPQAVPGTFVQMPTVRGWMLAGVAAAIIVVVAILILSNARNGGINTGATLAGTQTSSATSASTPTPAAATSPTPAASAGAAAAGAAGAPGAAGGPGAAGATGANGANGAAPQHLQTLPPGGAPAGANPVGGNHPTSAPTAPPTAAPTAWPAVPASMFATVDAGGNVLRQSGVVCNPCGGGGQYDVQFNRDVSQCSWTAVPSDSGTVDATVSSDDSNTPSVVRVQIKKPYGVSAGGFTLNVVCDTGASQWIVVGYHADRVRGTTGTQVQHVGTGQYAVTFPTTVSGCAYLVTNGDPGGQPYVYSPAVVLAYPGTQPNKVTVEFHDPGNSGAATDQPQYAPATANDPTALFPFHLQVYCNPNNYWLRATPPASAAGSHSAAIGARRNGGTFDIVFDRDLSACAWMATVGQGGGAGHIATTTGPGGARVLISDDSSAGVDLPFSFVALC